MKYPIGIQTFEKIREGGYVYVDKTADIFGLVNGGKYYFLSRPRRFGKSLLVSTLEAYFGGRKDLFEGLAIASLEKDWASHPVFHLDLSNEHYAEPNNLEMLLGDEVSKWEKQYGLSPSEDSVSRRFNGVIQRAFEQTGKKIVVLVDEYDAPLVNLIHKPDLLERNREVLSSFYKNLKTNDRYIHFAFLTGVTKFGHLSVFSALNNLEDISRDERYQSICGITENELHHYFDEGVGALAEKHGISKAECYDRLKHKYDGYHFCENGVGLYNPFSLLNALDMKRFGDYWYGTGTPTGLMLALRNTHADITQLPGRMVEASALENVNSYQDDITALLYQSGYLTISGVTEGGFLTIDFPNEEVRRGFITQLVPLYTTLNSGDTSSLSATLKQSLIDGDLETFIEGMRAMIASLSYEFFKDTEQAYQFVFYITCVLMGGRDLRTFAEKRTNRGRMDLLVETVRHIYIFEFKLDGSPDDALAQIHAKGYAEQWLTDARTIHLVGVNFSTTVHNIPDANGWKVEEYKH